MARHLNYGLWPSAKLNGALLGKLGVMLLWRRQQQQQKQQQQQQTIIELSERHVLVTTEQPKNVARDPPEPPNENEAKAFCFT